MLSKLYFYLGYSVHSSYLCLIKPLSLVVLLLNFVILGSWQACSPAHPGEPSFF